MRAPNSRQSDPRYSHMPSLLLVRPVALLVPRPQLSRSTPSRWSGTGPVASVGVRVPVAGAVSVNEGRLLVGIPVRGGGVGTVGRVAMTAVVGVVAAVGVGGRLGGDAGDQNGRASWRERGGQYV